LKFEIGGNAEKRGKLLKMFGTPQLSWPQGIAIADKEIFISNHGNDNISVFSTRGNFHREFGSPGDEDECLDGPRGLAISTTGELIVCDSDNNRLSVFI